MDKVVSKEKKQLFLLSVIFLYYAAIKSFGAGVEYQGIITVLFWGVLLTYVILNGNVRAHSKCKRKEFYLAFMSVCGILHVLSYFAFGFVDGVGMNMYDTSLPGIIKNILMLGSVLVFRELVRNHIINSVEKKYTVAFGIMIILVFSFAEINIKGLFELGSMEELLTFLSYNVLPPLLFNAFMTFSAYIAGSSGSIIYTLIINAPLWVISVLPNLRWITMLLIGSVYPLLCMIILRSVQKSTSTRGKKREIKEQNPYSWIAVALVMVTFVWFALGIFPVVPSIVVSNSMVPAISKGDLILIEKTNADSLKIGDIIQYKLEDIQVFHRIIDVKYNQGIRYFITKGDANNAEDPNPVTEAQVMGKYIARIPYIGWPVILLRQQTNETSVETG